MSEQRPIDDARVHFTAGDHVDLVGDLAAPASPRGAAVLLHPHPSYGGDRHNPVIAALHAALPASAVASLRFDFRSEFTGGVGERLDAVAAIDRVCVEVPDVPIVVIGYSFGAWIALGLRDDRVGAVVAIAPPLAAMPEVPSPDVRTLVLTPAHDQFSPPAQNGAIVELWRTEARAVVEHEVLEMADHFLGGSIASVAQQVTAWIAADL